MFSIRSNNLSAIAGSNVFSEFYDRLKAIREYHRKFPGVAAKSSEDVTVYGMHIHIYAHIHTYIRIYTYIHTYIYVLVFTCYL